MRKRNNFSLSHNKKMTADMGIIYPVTHYECIPGDTIRQSTTALIRMNPLVTPVMHRVFVRLHHFFIPYRLLWEDWEDFKTGGEDGLNASVHPTVTSAALSESCLCDFLGVPPDTYSTPIVISALPLRAYALIYNQYFRDQNLCPELPVSLASGNDTTTNVDLALASWGKDYFTTCRTDQQLGDATVVPVAGEAPIFYDGTANSTSVSAQNGSGIDYKLESSGAHVASSSAAQTDPDYDLKANLAAASGLPLNDLRLASFLQREKEQRQQYGARYDEYLNYEFGLKKLDARLQHPEYLGGGKSTIQFSEVLSTDDSNTGDLHGHGIAAMKSNAFTKFIPEDGMIMTLMSVLPENLYTETLHRSWLRTTKEDYYDPNAQFLGEQEVTNREAQINHSTPDGVFGYQKIYDELRFHPSTIAGGMHSTYLNWHYGRTHTGDIALNQGYIECVPTKRTQADTQADSMIITAHHNIVAKRHMQKNPMPKII